MLVSESLAKSGLRIIPVIGRMVSDPVRSYWRTVMYGVRDLTVHSSGEVEEFADWLRDVQG